MTKIHLFCCAVCLSLLSLHANAAGHAVANYGEITQLYKKGQKDKALELLDAYLSKLPKDAWGRNVTQARFLKGVILAELKRPQEAIRVFNKLTQDYPALPEPYNNLAALYASQGQYEAARDALERAIRTNPSYATAHENLSDIYAALSSQAYEGTLRASKSSPDGKPTQALITELCDNYGKMASQVSGRGGTVHSAADLSILRGINMAQNSATKPPAKVDIDEMAMAPEDAAEIPESPRKLGKMPQETAAQETVTAKPNKTIAETSTKTASDVAIKAVPEAQAKQDKDGSSTAERNTIVQAVQGWASAWAKKNAGGYLAYYARDFKTPNGETRSEWESTRKERIAKPKSIKITVEDTQVSMVDSTHARVSFRQIYRSDTLQTSTHKALLMEKNGSRWLIQEERVAR